MLTVDPEPFGDDFLADVSDLDDFIRSTIRFCIAGIDARHHRAAAAAHHTIYFGGPVHWDGLHLAEAA
ncbi:hypothetical protein [Arthrobacter flavus]|uniref:Uncharacterized protein n=1 Tax=Arthrobacter flavus TaxID=95172 RepID=A0ABW4Q3T3_9MICC